MENWLRHQDQKVFTNNSEYNWCLGDSGALHASVLGLMLLNIFTCDMVNRTDHTLRNCVKGQGRWSWRTGVPSRQTKKEEWSYVNFIEFKKEKVLHLRKALSRQHPILGTGWLENNFAENDVRVLRSKLNMLSFLKVGKRSITYWDALSKE